MKIIDKYNSTIGTLKLENERLQQRIDNAIEYIKDLLLEFYDYECEQLIIGKYMTDELLEILKGDSNE